MGRKTHRRHCPAFVLPRHVAVIGALFPRGLCDASGGPGGSGTAGIMALVAPQLCAPEKGPCAAGGGSASGGLCREDLRASSFAAWWRRV